MCGIACYYGKRESEGREYILNARTLLKHRGPDDSGIYENKEVKLLQTRLSIVELSPLGHQPMLSACGRYVIVFNGEIYNHKDLRTQFLPNHSFRGHSDTETLIELFCLQKEKMLQHLVGMWAMIIWDTESEKIFISRDRFGQKPLYTRFTADSEWLFASEIKPLLTKNEHPDYDATALAEYIALGNYGHLGTHTFFKQISQFPPAHFAWLLANDTEIKYIPYWILPDINNKDKKPFDKTAENTLKDLVIDAVLSQTLADVPIGITLSGGIDSSIITGVLAKYYTKDIHVFTAQSPNSKYDETNYVNAVLNKWNNPNFIVHKKDLNTLSVKDDLEKYIRIQEEPFGDPSIIAHGFLMQMAADAGIKVVLNGQGADELFFGYNNMSQAILVQQLKSFQFSVFSNNLKAMKLGKNFLFRAVLQALLPDIEHAMRQQSRNKRRVHIDNKILNNVNDSYIKMYSYKKIYNVWAESVQGVHIPHLVHYDDRNGMANSLEGRSPFLDHRITDFVATLQHTEFLKNGKRKYILRESCKEFLPDEVLNRTDKIGFFTPLADSLLRDKEWVLPYLKEINFIKPEFLEQLSAYLLSNKMDTPNALHIWRQLSVLLWMKEFNINN